MDRCREGCREAKKKKKKRQTPEKVLNSKRLWRVSSNRSWLLVIELGRRASESGFARLHPTSYSRVNVRHQAQLAGEDFRQEDPGEGLAERLQP